MNAMARACALMGASGDQPFEPLIRDGAVGSHDGEPPIGCEGQTPFAFVDEVMMSVTYGQEVREIGWAASFPGDDVVDLAVIEPGFASFECAVAVHGS